MKKITTKVIYLFIYFCNKYVLFFFMIKYSKYNSCGNDFIIVDNRKNIFPINNQYIEELCDRKNGIGADGLILLSLADNCCYNKTYFNSDGNESTFCGNGSMCCGHFAFNLGLLSDKNTG